MLFPIDFAYPILFVIGLCFIPNMGNVDLSGTMPSYGYILLFLVGIVASCALVVPGVSGSMLLLILGYYQPMINAISGLKTNAGHSLSVFVVFAIGLLLGFFSIAKIMKILLLKYPRTTDWAIVGFVLGSIIAIFLIFGELH